MQLQSVLPSRSPERAATRRPARHRRHAEVDLGDAPRVAPSRVLFVCSSGGHLAQLLQLRPWWERHDRAWVSFRAADVVSSLEGERLYFGYAPTTRNVKNLLRNLVLSVSVLRRERPDVIVSTGAGMAVPFFWVGRLLGCATVYVEVYDRVDSPTLTGRLCRRASDLFLVQWKRQQAHYPGATYAGPLY